MNDAEDLNIESPSIPKAVADDFVIPSYEIFDRIVLNESGYDEDSEEGQKILDNVVADSTDEKIFTIRDRNNTDDELKQSFKIEDTTYEILKNSSFDEYWRQHILANLDTEKDKKLLEQCDAESFIGDRVYRKLDELGKLEVFYYVDFFKEILSLSENEETLSLVELDDEAFESMPNVMRLY